MATGAVHFSAPVAGPRRPGSYTMANERKWSAHIVRTLVPTPTEGSSLKETAADSPLGRRNEETGPAVALTECALPDGARDSRGPDAEVVRADNGVGAGFTRSINRAAMARVTRRGGAAIRVARWRPRTSS